MKNKIFYLAVFLMVTGSMGAHAVPTLLVGYAPDVASAPGVTASGIDDTGSNATVRLLPSCSFAAGCINVRPNEVGAIDESGAVANNTFFQFSVASDPGLTLDLFSLDFGAYKGGDQEPRGWVLRSSLDGFAADIASGQTTCAPAGTIVCTAPDPFSVDLSGSLFQGVSMVAFRVYSFSPDPTFMVVNYVDLELYGMVSSTDPHVNEVPEPTTLALLGLGLAGMGFSRRKKKV